MSTWVYLPGIICSRCQCKLPNMVLDIGLVRRWPALNEGEMPDIISHQGTANENKDGTTLPPTEMARV